MLCICGCCGCIRDSYSGIIRGELFYKARSVKLNFLITIVQFPLQVFVVMDATLTSIYNFQVRHSCFVEYYIYIN